MPVPAPPTVILAEFARRGFALRAAGGGLSVSPGAALTAADRETLRARRNELLTALSVCEPWDTETALRLMNDADGLVERSGVSGRHPAVADAAATVVSTHVARNMGVLRLAVAEFVAVVGRVAVEAGRNRAFPGAPVSHDPPKWAAPGN